MSKDERKGVREKKRKIEREKEKKREMAVRMSKEDSGSPGFPARFGPLPDTKPSLPVTCFVEGLAGGRLLYTRCDSCDREYLPPREGCRCGSRSMVWEDVGSPRGKLVSHAGVAYAPEGFDDRLPYIVGLVELDRGLRLLGWLRTDPGSEPRIGARVEVVPTPMGDGHHTFEIVILSS